MRMRLRKLILGAVCSPQDVAESALSRDGSQERDIFDTEARGRARDGVQADDAFITYSQCPP